ncbi:MAG: hypothetical protein AAGF12_30385 [Myxococcota bacterium]
MAFSISRGLPRTEVERSPQWPFSEGPSLLVVLVFAASCGGETPTDPPEVQTDDGDEVAASSSREAPPAVPPPFDFRRVRLDPDQHIDEVLTCHVDAAGRRTVIRERDALPQGEGMAVVHYAEGYPDWAVRRQDVRCVTSTSRAWVDVLFREAQLEAPPIAQGRVVQLRLLSAYEGFSDYPYGEFVELLSGSSIAAPDNEAPSPDDGFDFSAAVDRPVLVGSEQVCAVDFVSQIKPVDDRVRRRLDYEDDVAFRADLRCLHPAGDAWVDVAANLTNRETLLELRRGASVRLRILDRDGGFADYPIAEVVE